MPARSNTHRPPRAFDEDCREAVGGLRAALIDLFRSVDADPTRPQDVARRFKLDKSLAWKVSRAIQSEDPLAAAARLPGSSGVSILLKGLQRSGASADALERVRAASDVYERVIEVHSGDRETLRLMLDSMGRNGKSMELSRKQAFRGNSGVYGMQCAVRIGANFAAPVRDNPSRLDLAFVGGWTDVRRFRSVPRWPILDVTHRRDDNVPDAHQQFVHEPVCEDGWVLERFCAGAMPEIHVREVPGGMRYELGDGPVGRTGDFSAYAGYVLRDAVSRYASRDDRYGQFRAGIAFPAEHVVLDLFVHHEMTEALDLEVQHFARLPNDVVESDPSHHLPVVSHVHDLGRNPMVATPLVDRYDTIVESVMSHCGWRLADFHCLRIVDKYPPVLSTIGVRYTLRDGS